MFFLLVLVAFFFFFFLGFVSIKRLLGRDSIVAAAATYGLSIGSDPYQASDYLLSDEILSTLSEKDDWWWDSLSDEILNT